MKPTLPIFKKTTGTYEQDIRWHLLEISSRGTTKFRTRRVNMAFDKINHVDGQFETE
jgi:hypothetical protein